MKIRLNFTGFGKKKKTCLPVNFLPISLLISLLVGSPYYEGIVRPLKHIVPEFIEIEAEMENPQALLFAFREAIPNLRIVEEKQLKTDGRGMKGRVGNLS